MALLSAFWASRKSWTSSALRSAGTESACAVERAAKRRVTSPARSRSSNAATFAWNALPRARLRHRMLAVDQNQQSAYVEGEAHLPFGQFLVPNSDLT
jgi:hypothetical protein